MLVFFLCLLVGLPVSQFASSPVRSAGFSLFVSLPV